MGKKKTPDWTGLQDSAVGRCRWRLGNSGIEFDERGLELWRGDMPLNAEAKPLYVLMVLVRYPNALVLKDHLALCIWHRRTGTDAVLSKAVTKLRMALGDSDQQLIQTAHGKGYRLMLLPERLEPV